MPSPVYTQSCFVMGAVLGYCRVHCFYPVSFPTYSTDVLQLSIFSTEMTTVVTDVVAVSMLVIPTIHHPFFILTCFFPLCPSIAIAICPTRRSNCAEPALIPLPLPLLRYTGNDIIIPWSQVLIWPFNIVCLTFGTTSALTTTVFVNHLIDICITIITRIHRHIISNIFTHCSPFSPLSVLLAHLRAALPVSRIFPSTGSLTSLWELESLDSESASSPSAASVWLAPSASLPSCLRSAAGT